MSDSILLASAIYNFTLNKIAYHQDYNPNSDLPFSVSAKDSNGVIHAKASSDLAIALNELFEVVSN